MRLIFWFLLVANLGLLVLRYGVGLPQMFLKPTPIVSPYNKSLDRASPITLLSEVVDGVASTPLAVDENKPKVEPKPEALCKSVGPFEAESIAEGFAARLSALDVKSVVEKRIVSAGTGYWVYLEPLENRKKTRQQLLDLQGRGIDCYIIPKGSLANGISLGMFSQLGLANKRILELKLIGYDAKTQIIERSYEEPWVVLKRGEDQKVGLSAWKMLLKGKNNLKEEQKVCLDVDSQ